MHKMSLVPGYLVSTPILASPRLIGRMPVHLSGTFDMDTKYPMYPCKGGLNWIHSIRSCWKETTSNKSMSLDKQLYILTISICYFEFLAFQNLFGTGLADLMGERSINELNQAEVFK